MGLASRNSYYCVNCNRAEKPHERGEGARNSYYCVNCNGKKPQMIVALFIQFTQNIRKMMMYAIPTLCKLAAAGLTLPDSYTLFSAERLTIFACLHFAPGTGCASIPFGYRKLLCYCFAKNKMFFAALISLSCFSPHIGQFQERMERAHGLSWY